MWIKALWKPRIAGWSDDDVASNLKLWLDMLYNISPDEQRYKQELKEMEQGP
jgi:hypothetical protein